MSFISGVMDFFKKFREAAKAGKDFNPLLEEVEKEIESLHKAGKLDDAIYKAEQSYVKEHGEYQSKGTHTDAADSMADVHALKHLLDELAKADDLDPAFKAKVTELLNEYHKMTDILGPLGKI